MEYRRMEKLNIAPSMLGFGCMRFPALDNGEINEPLAEKMFDTAIKAGVTYIDTAYPYHGGKSEIFVGKMLKKYDRNSLFLATKLPMWLVNETSDVERYFNEQLKKLQTDYIDFYLLHAMNKERWEVALRIGVIDELERLRSEGKIKYIGFSFHDEYDVFEEIINYRNWDFCQIQFNYMDTNIQAGLKGYKLAESKKIPVVVMEPIKGGSLAAFPKEVEEIFKKQNPDVSISSWALRFVGTFPGVKVILSGMSDMTHVEDNLKTFDKFKPLSEDEKKVIDRVVEAVNSRIKVGCTNCKYCMPCPFGIDIPTNFSIWNEHSMYGNDKKAVHRYTKDFDASKQADKCKKCGKCETMCPQKIKIRDMLEQVTIYMDKLIRN